MQVSDHFSEFFRGDVVLKRRHILAAVLNPQAHRFVVHRDGGVAHYLYAEPVRCVCIFIGTEANYQDYRDILSQGLQQPDFVSPDYKTQASALLYGDLYDWDNLDQPDSLAEYLREYY